MKKQPLKVYYAHSMRIYWSKRETKELAFIQKHFQNVVNPPTDIKTRGSSMEPFLKSIEECDAVVFSRYEGFIGKGVYTEITHAISKQKPVWMITKSHLTRQMILQSIQLNNIKIYNPSDWKRQYAFIKRRFI